MAARQIWNTRSAVSPSGKAFTRAFNLAHAMVRDLDGRICFWSTSMERLYGWSRAEALGRVSHDLLKTEFPKSLGEINAELISVGHWEGELCHRRRDGDAVFVASHWALDRDETRRAAWIIEINNDISAQKVAEASLRANTTELETLLDAVPAIVWTAHDAECRSITGSRASYEFLRVSTDANPSLTAPEGERPIHFKVLANGRELAPEDLPVQRAARGATIRDAEVEVVFDDGTSRWIFGNAAPLLDDKGQPRGAVSAFVDVTDRKRVEAAKEAAERRLREMQFELLHESRLRTMGQMAAALAHELHQPLGAATNFLSAAHLALQTSESDAVARALARIEKAVEQTVRAGAILGRLRDYIARGETEKHIVSVRQLIKDAVALAVIGKKDTGIRFDFVEHERPILADRIQIQQVVFNLVSNALDATEGKTPREIVVGTRSPTNAELEIFVADTGPGLPDNPEEVFRPFATTKAKGMGVGLSICRIIAEAHGGRLWAEQRPGGGAVFRFSLPTVESEEVVHA